MTSTSSLAPAAAAAPAAVPTEPVQGLLELHPQGFGFLRNMEKHYETTPDDPYVSADLIRKLDLRPGMLVEGEALRQERNGNFGPERHDRRQGGRNQRGPDRRQQPPPRPKAQGPRVTAIHAIDGADPELAKGRPYFERLTPIDPREWLKLETVPDRLTTRVIDLFTPIGKGQRGLIVAPPRSGKTVLIQHMADAIATNNPEVELIVLLVDERPEEVTDMRRSIRGTVYASSNDHETSSHVGMAQLVIERCKRLVEQGRDVVVLLDSITRLARAFNKHVGSTGRTLSGGLDVRAMDVPKRLFGTARAFDEGGSLTVIATALIETGSRMDDVIFQEFKGTGNMELVLDRRLAERRVFPAIDLFGSGTRKEERLIPQEQLDKINLIRRTLAGMNPVDTMQTLLKQLAKQPTNIEFIESLSRMAR